MLNQTSFRLKTTLLPSDNTGVTTQVINKVNENGERFFPTFSQETLVLTNEDRTVMETTKASCINGQLTFHKRGLSDDQSETIIEKRKLQWNPWTLCFVTAGAGDLLDKDDDIIRTGKQNFTNEVVFGKGWIFRGRLTTKGGIDYPEVATFERLSEIQNPSAWMMVSVADDGEVYKYNKKTDTWSVITTSTPVATPDATTEIAGKVKKIGFKDFARNYTLNDEEVNQKVVVMEALALWLGTKYDAIVSSDGKYGYTTVAQALKDRATKIWILWNLLENETWESTRVVELIEGIKNGVKIEFSEALCSVGDVIKGIGKINQSGKFESINNWWEKSANATIIRNLTLQFRWYGSFPTTNYNGAAFFQSSNNLNHTILLENCKIKVPTSSSTICLSNGVHLILKDTRIDRSGSGSLANMMIDSKGSWIALLGDSYADLGENARMSVVIREDSSIMGQIILDIEDQWFCSDKQWVTKGLILRGSGNRHIWSGNEKWPNIIQIDTGIKIQGEGYLNFSRLGSQSITLPTLRSCNISNQTIIFDGIGVGVVEWLRFAVLGNNHTGSFRFQMPTASINYSVFKNCRFDGYTTSRNYFLFVNNCPMSFVDCYFGGGVTIQTGNKCSMLAPYSSRNASVNFTGGSTGKILGSMNVNFSGNYSDL